MNVCVSVSVYECIYVVCVCTVRVCLFECISSMRYVSEREFVCVCVCVCVYGYKTEDKRQ